MKWLIYYFKTTELELRGGEVINYYMKTEFFHGKFMVYLTVTEQVKKLINYWVTVKTVARVVIR